MIAGNYDEVISSVQSTTVEIKIRGLFGLAANLTLWMNGEEQKIKNDKAKRRRAAIN